MALGIRGANPIWSEVDLQGKLFDDTFWLFVLENTIPYIPATVYSDPDFNTPINNPIQFLANGTLPIDIYFESEHVYRLEFRQRIEGGQPTQQDPLIYEVDNYVAGTGGSTPVDTVAFASSNQVTNPQFALMSLQNPVTIAGTDPDPIELAPGWTLELAGTGTVTITQVPLNNSNINPSNAPYALQLTLNGWTADSVILRQRFEQNGMLWGDKVVSTTITSKLNGSPQSITATLVDSNSAVLGTVLPLTPLNEDWNEYTGFADLAASTNPDTPPSAYVDYVLHLPSDIDIYVTSIQLVVQELEFQPPFEQDTINRQIDHSYNTAYPIVPVGTIIDFGGFSIPQHYYYCDGTAKNRVRDYLLFNAITTTETVTLTNGVNTFTVVSSVDYYIGMHIEGTGIPAATTISNISGTMITMSANATATGPSLVRFFAWGNGNGTTTFNVPDLLGWATVGAGGATLGSHDGVGLQGGAATTHITDADLPSNVPVASAAFSTQSVQTGVNTNVPGGAGGWTGGSGGLFSLVQPSALVKKCIRYQ